jgi:outer membrane lipoprotein-sorting protein
MARILMFCLLVLSPAASFAQSHKPLTPKEILDKMVSVYATCSSYSDKGESKAVFSDTGRVTLKPFATAFIRPSKFRFEFEDQGRTPTQYVVWQDGASIKSWWTIEPEVRSFESLDFALAGATGVSGGSAMQVPSMLFGDLGDTHRIQKLTQLVLVGAEAIGGKAAYKIDGTDFRDHKVTIWIDKKTFLLLRTSQVDKLPNAVEATETISYQPEINTAIPADSLAFKH